MSEDRLSGYGIVLELGGEEDGGYQRISGLTSLKPPKEESGLIEVTEHRTPDEPDYGSMEFIADPVTDYGEITGKLNWKPGNASQAALRAARGLTRWYRVTYPQNARVTRMKGVLTKLEEPEFGSKDKKAIEVDFSIKVTGKPVVA